MLIVIGYFLSCNVALCFTENALNSDLRDLLSEYNLLKDVNHKNVVRLLGVCTRAGAYVYQQLKRK